MTPLGMWDGASALRRIYKFLFASWRRTLATAALVLAAIVGGTIWIVHATRVPPDSPSWNLGGRVGHAMLTNGPFEPQARIATCQQLGDAMAATNATEPVTANGITIAIGQFSSGDFSDGCIIASGPNG